MVDVATLGEYVRDHYAKLKPWAKRDLRPCMDFLDNDLGLKPEVYRLEDMPTWLPELESKTGTSFSDQKVNAGKSQDYQNEITPGIREFLQAFYLRDFEAFYPDELR